MVAFTYNTKILVSIGHSLFFLNYDYYPEEETSPDATKQVFVAKDYLKKLANAQLKSTRLLLKVQKMQAV